MAKKIFSSFLKMEICKLILKCTRKCKEPEKANIIFKRKNKCWQLTLISKPNVETKLTKRMCYGHIESVERNRESKHSFLYLFI